MAEHIDESTVTPQIFCHELIIAVKGFFFRLAFIISRIVDVLSIDDMLRTDDEVKRHLLHEGLILFADGFIHANLYAKAQRIAAVFFVGLPVHLRVKCEIHIARVIEVEMLGKDETYAFLFGFLQGVFCLHFGIRREFRMAVTVKNHDAPQAFASAS